MSIQKSNKILRSYHIFTFPFKWEIKNNKRVTFSNKVDIGKINLPVGSSWSNVYEPADEVMKRELYNERSFFYSFVHDALYDKGNHESLVKHFERKECILGASSTYNIKCKGKNKTYTLDIKSISLDFVFTGVGILSFYLENFNYQDIKDVLMINQFGRRIYPPFYDRYKGIEGTKDHELPDAIYLEGLNGAPESFYEDYTDYTPDTIWKPASFIKSLLNDFETCSNLLLEPVIDDRMFVTCWIANQELSSKIMNHSLDWKKEELWYAIVFVDKEEPSCQNEEMMEKMITEHSLSRWQKYGTIYGLSRHSFVSLTDNSIFSKETLLPYLRTTYYRIVELCLIQRASQLKFADEITKIFSPEPSRTSQTAEEVRSLYRESIKFVNKIFFREVTAQDQGIEIYDKLQSIMRIPEHVKDLEGEIQELNSYLSLLEDKQQNKNLTRLTILGALFVIPTFIIGYYGMNAEYFGEKMEEIKHFNGINILNLILITLVPVIVIAVMAKQRWVKWLSWSVLFLLVVLAVYLTQILIKWNMF